MKVAFDESGNTGANLLDKEQSIYALASVCYTDKEAEELLSTVNTKMEEVHFVKLKKNHKSKVIQFLNHELISNSKIKYSISDKQFEIICKLVDTLIEKVLFENKINIYENGTHLATANLIWVFSITNGYEEDIRQMLLLFQTMMRKKNKQAINDFYSHILSIKKGLLNNVIFHMILESSKYIDGILDCVRKYDLDPAYSSFVSLANLWYYELEAEFSIIHDKSKQIEYWKEMIAFISNRDLMPEKEMRIIGGQKMTYPLKIKELELVDSMNCKQVQIADLVASSMCYAINNTKKGKEDDFTKAILQSKAHPFKDSRYLFPSMDVTPDSLGEIGHSNTETLDYLTESIVKNKSIYDSIDIKMKNS